MALGTCLDADCYSPSLLNSTQYCTLPLGLTHCLTSCPDPHTNFSHTLLHYTLLALRALHLADRQRQRGESVLAVAVTACFEELCINLATNIGFCYNVVYMCVII